MTGKRREGTKYESKVQDMLTHTYGDFYVDGPWFRFWSTSNDRVRYCQPDGLLFDLHGRSITIIEVKLKHTTEAWWQLRHLYVPVIAALFPPTVWTLKVCEIVRWYDPATVYPERVALVPNVLAVGDKDFGVHIWRP